ncbi:uncharacterized protein CC84DRAFT_124071 [Paraphaeosphaeria sporulosa]|uniref:Uncharacterized protein n=1 Tax=Paraphaeosphaeria sporulosa TaxID=1460663 RepID=A0A177CY34_9PLEO|nr:uncharacterized protein CC84DRAFT_124071 [Paraphaeosphaeria sporulosa]OAG12475.1 hypothetical protein CC84DRAFT_124071 [Paraphaeosphaeria sporulosa]
MVRDPRGHVYRADAMNTRITRLAAETMLRRVGTSSMQRCTTVVDQGSSCPKDMHNHLTVTGRWDSYRALGSKTGKGPRMSLLEAYHDTELSHSATPPCTIRSVLELRRNSLCPRGALFVRCNTLPCCTEAAHAEQTDTKHPARTLVQGSKMLELKNWAHPAERMLSAHPNSCLARVWLGRASTPIERAIGRIWSN